MDGTPRARGATRASDGGADARHVDVLIVGAGLSGVCTAAIIARGLPGKSFAVLEARDAVGGTWDLFRYPGIRSDSDMATLGYAFRPWTGDAAIADGPSILGYVRDTVKAEGIADRIRTGHRLAAADWDEEAALWRCRVAVRDGDGTREEAWACRFLHLCTGYYDYDGGHAPTWPGQDGFGGRVVHPQHWPEDLDWTGKRVAVIGSGATAVTLVPAMAERAAAVTMVQRSPSYVATLPRRDRLGLWAQRRLGARAGHALTRWKNILLGISSYTLSRRAPRFVANGLRRAAAEAAGPGFDADTHMTPRYDPWDQRLCVAPDGDFFAAIRSGKAEVVTDTVAGFEAGGLRLGSGRHVPADVVVTATGLRVKVIDGIDLRRGGVPVSMADAVSYRGAMYSGVPNLAVALGYINASWTLKCELIARYTVRLIRYMDRHGLDWAEPLAPPAAMPRRKTFELSSGYLERSRADLPSQVDHAPWRLHQNYIADLRSLRFGRVAAGMRFGRATRG